MLLISLGKWISLAVTFGLGAMALFFGTYREAQIQKNERLLGLDGLC